MNQGEEDYIPPTPSPPLSPAAGAAVSHSNPVAAVESVLREILAEETPASPISRSKPAKQNPTLVLDSDDEDVVVWEKESNPLVDLAQAAVTVEAGKSATAVKIKRKRNSKKKKAEPVEEKKAFRIAAKKFFLTYPRCDATKERLVEVLREKGFITEYYVAQEQHEDGGYHLHAAVMYANKLNIKSANSFDFDGFHPNVQAAREWRSVVSYVTKHPNYIHNVSFDDSHSENFVRRLVDYESWQTYRTQKQYEAELKAPDIVLRAWQIEAQALLLSDPKPRRIIWIYSDASNTGKTTFRRYIEHSMPTMCIDQFTEVGQIVYLYKNEKVIWFDIARTDIQDKFYHVIESLSNNPGYFYYTKYNGGKKVLKCHIVVSCNYDPPYQKLPQRLLAIEATVPPDQDVVQLSPYSRAEEENEVIVLEHVE